MAKSGKLITNTVTEFGVSAYGEFNWTSTQDVNANKDVVTWWLTNKVNPSTYYRTINNAKVTINGVESTRTTSYTAYNDNTILSGTLDIPHENDGTKTFSVSVAIAYAQNTPNATATGSFTLDVIPRGNNYAINKQMLQSGQSATISITKAIATNTSTITWKRGSASGTLLTKSSANSVSVSYDTLSAGMIAGTNAVVDITCISYNASGAEVGDRANLQLAVSTGKLPFTIWGNENGDVGVAVGAFATESGFKIYLPTTFGSSAIPVNLELLNAYGINNYEVIWSGTESSYGNTNLTCPTSKFNAIIIVTSTGGSLNCMFVPKMNANWGGQQVRITDMSAGYQVFRVFRIWSDAVVCDRGSLYKTYGSSTITNNDTVVLPRYIIGVHI